MTWRLELLMLVSLERWSDTPSGVWILRNGFQVLKSKPEVGGISTVCFLFSFSSHTNPAKSGSNNTLPLTLIQHVTAD